jgi:hypothetical protein
MKPQAVSKPKAEEVPTMLMSLKAPVEFFERLDRWCEQQKQAQGMTIKPSRPTAIRYIVYNFLLQQEQQQQRATKRTKRAKRKGKR